jgi:perosamine synthetase
MDHNAERLALEGGPKAKTTPYAAPPNRYGEEEMAELRDALAQGTLFYAQGKKVQQFEAAFAERYGVPHCVAASSCTGAIHAAVAAVGVGPGDEVITAPITDMGTLSGLMFQGGIPVFADLDPHTYHMTPESAAACLSPRTKAILAVHLAGNPCDSPGIAEVARKAGVAFLEDCAQSYLAALDGQLAGTFGDIGCFSLNEFKHISCGDGGMCLTRDPGLARRIRMATDKAYSREPGASRFPEFLATNYRMTELQGAVALAQLRKLDAICAARHAHGERLTALLHGAPGIHPPRVPPGGYATYWFYLFRVDEEALGVSTDQFAEALRAEGVPAGAHYIGKCVYEYPALGVGRWALGSQSPYDPTTQRPCCPNAEAILRTGIIVPIHQAYTETDIEETAAAIRKVACHYARLGLSE